MKTADQSKFEKGTAIVEIALLLALLTVTAISSVSFFGERASKNFVSVDFRSESPSVQGGSGGNLEGSSGNADNAGFA